MVTDNDTCKIKVLETVHAPFARKLERELTALTAERDQLRARAERAEAELNDLRTCVWKPANTPPTPSRPGVLCDRYLALDPWGGPPTLLYYRHDAQEWTLDGGDTQRVAWWCDISPLLAMVPMKEGAQ